MLMPETYMLRREACQSDERDNKRPRISVFADGPKGKENTKDTECHIDVSANDVTPDLWVHVMLFLPYTDILQCSAVNRFFLHGISPRIEKIEVYSSSEMRVVPARRFGGVKEVIISCLFRNRRIMHCGDRYGEYEVVNSATELDIDVMNVSVPFLSQFPSLDIVWFGGGVYNEWSDDGVDWVDYWDVDGQDERNDRLVHGLILSICGAYRSGAIPCNASVRGLEMDCHKWDADETIEDDDP